MRMISYIVKNSFAALCMVVLVCLAFSCQRKTAQVQENEKLDERCYLTPEVGNCKMAVKRYYYDSKAKGCKEFIYGGCNGVVPFVKLEICREKCNCD